MYHCHLITVQYTLYDRKEQRRCLRSFHSSFRDGQTTHDHISTCITESNVTMIQHVRLRLLVEVTLMSASVNWEIHPRLVIMQFC